MVIGSAEFVDEIREPPEGGRFANRQLRRREDWRVHAVTCAVQIFGRRSWKQLLLREMHALRWRVQSGMSDLWWTWTANCTPSG